MEQTIIQSTKDVLKKKVNFFEQQQKERIITACKSDMKYAEVLAFIKNEIEMSETGCISQLQYQKELPKSDTPLSFLVQSHLALLVMPSFGKILLKAEISGVRLIMRCSRLVKKKTGMILIPL